MSQVQRFIKSKIAAAVLLVAAIGLVFIPFAKFPFKFMIISGVVLLFAWLQDGNAAGLNFKKLRRKHLIIIPVCYIILELAMDFAVQPLINFLFNEPADYSAFDMLKGDTPKYLKYLLYMWISAAVGEELLFRGFVFLQLKKIFGEGQNMLIVVLSAALFALPHLYQGYAGLVMTFLFGLVFGFMYLKFKNIWVNIILHGLIDSLFLTLAYLGATGFYG